MLAWVFWLECDTRWKPIIHNPKTQHTMQYSMLHWMDGTWLDPLDGRKTYGIMNMLQTTSYYIYEHVPNWLQ